MVEYDRLTDEQQRAVDALDRNVTLTAGAGTGKTTTLTARYLKMIESGIAASDDPASDLLLPEQILTTTFTERAANELESSIRTEITERIATLDAEEFPAWRRVADELEHGYIHTLHGFCARLLREHTLRLEPLDPGFTTLDENETTAMLHDVVETTLREHETHPATQTLARRFSRAQLHDVLTDLLSERPASLTWAQRWADASEQAYLSFVETELHPIDPDEAAARLADPTVVDALTTLQELVADPPAISTEGTAWQRAVTVVELLEGGYDDGVPSRAKQTLIAQLSSALTTAAGAQYASYTGAATHWDNHPQKATFDTAIEQLVATLEPETYAVEVDLERDRQSYPFVTALAELTQIAGKTYAERKQQQNAADFTDLVSYTVDFLAAPENAHIRQELQAQFEYVMLDEFQDTDPRQWDLIRLLTTSPQGNFDADNIFVVGDVKQSIYRFRNADVTQFKEITDMLAAAGPAAETTDEDTGAADQLSTNFRTLPAVLDPINELFDAVFDADGEPYEATPQPLTPARSDPADLGSTEYLAVPTDPELRADRCAQYDAFATADPEHEVELEAMALAARLSQVLAEPYQVYPEEDEEQAADDSRAIEPKDIAVLLRSRTHLKTFERAFEDAGVPYSIASGIGFYETTEITALLNLFRALADPHDERALYATLRSPLFGFTDDTLAALKTDDDTLWAALADADAAEIQTAYEMLTTWRERAGVTEPSAATVDGSWAAYLTEIIDATGYLVSVSAGDRGQQAVANVEKFREQLRGFSDDGVQSLTTLVSRIERRVELGGRESEAETTDEGVQILTIHDAKGMEFPFVVVPQISRPFKDDAAIGDGQVEFERIGDQYAVGMKAPSPDDPFELGDTMARETIRDRRRAEERAEEKRVLYVACTRARDHLLLSGLHETADEATEPTFRDLEEADPAEPSSWRDWVQPELLSEDVCATLDTTSHVERALGDGTYTVSIPTPPAQRSQPTTDHEPAMALSPHPPTPPRSFAISATDLAALLGDRGTLQCDAATQTLYVTADAEHDMSQETEAVTDASASTRSPETSSDTDGSVSPTASVDARVFGEVVHRLCELRPPESKWPDLIHQTLVDESIAGNLTSDLLDRVETHARRGIEYVNTQAASGVVDQQYDELYITAEFDRGEISGFIDHLIVTPDAYHVIDYKTGAMTQETLAAEADYYETQLKAYAIALNQQDSDRRVRVSLVFTALDTAWETMWPPSEVHTFYDEIRAAIWDRSAEIDG
ncbi:UvrD-helicase domain-containing protein [Halorubrum sp. HHNYT27]|uniref:UvrD-helicase domain-containing protein n=1 Tax=Halorubrum sp. HHNYT27 TaxID=3402275 RepID=UPI003EBC0983